jgi:SAM-dependent methyltransferase
MSGFAEASRSKGILKMNNEEIRDNMANYTFYHSIKLTEDISTPGLNYANELLSLDVMDAVTYSGKRVLDIGCRDGKFAFEAEKRGAVEVVAIDNDLSRAAIEFLIPYFDSKVIMLERNMLELAPIKDGTYDIILFFGVLYHLRYPFYSLRIIRDMLKSDGKLLIETALLKDDGEYPLLYCPIEGEGPYEPTSCTFFNERALRDTLKSLGVRVDAVHRWPSESSGPLRTGSRAAEKVGRLVRGLLPAFGRSRALPIERVAFVCSRASGLADPEVLAYWEGVHTLETGDRAWARDRMSQPL